MSPSQQALIPLARSPKILFSTFDVTRQSFFRTSLSFAIVNLKPIVPGHVLVCPMRVVKRFADLTVDEVSSLFLSAQRIGKVVEKAYNAESLTISVQDGEAAGQTVNHVHVHILPRKTGDFAPNDKVYDELDKHELYEALGDHFMEKTRRSSIHMDAEPTRVARTAEEMDAEARWLEGFFYGNEQP